MKQIILTVWVVFAFITTRDCLVELYAQPQDTMQYLDNRIANLEQEIATLKQIKEQLQQPIQPEEPEEIPISEYGYKGFTTRELQDGEVAIDTLPFVITQPGTYLLTQDLIAADSGVAIMSSDVVLDLNGYRILYGSVAKLIENGWSYHGRVNGNVCHSGIVCPSRPDRCYDFAFDWNYLFRKSFQNVTIKNGLIESSHDETLNHSIALDISGLTDPIVENVVTIVHCNDSQAIAVSGGMIDYCTFIDNGRTVVNRHSMLCVVNLEGGVIKHCDIVGGAQTGIRCGINTSCAYNRIAIDSVASNGYCITCNDGVEVMFNRCLPKNGRGIFIHSDNGYVHDNVVDAKEKGNAEYATLQTHGIKIEHGSGNRIESNAVTVRDSEGGQPTALNIDLKEGESNQIKNNLFRALKEGEGPEEAVALCIVDANLIDQVISQNIFESNHYMLRHIGDCSNVVITGNVFRSIEHNGRKSEVFYRGRDYGTFQARIVDNTYAGGCNPLTCEWPSKYVGWDDDQELFISGTTIRWDAEQGIEIRN